MSADEVQALGKVNSVMLLGAAEEAKSNLELIMKPYANWEDFLTPGLTSIAILGELIFIAAAEAFQVKLIAAGRPPRFLRQPGSFRACLMQLCDQGWKAFNKAHNNMDQIRLQTLTVPKHLANAVQVLSREPQVVKAMLPSRLRSLRTVVEKCQELASSVEEEFASLIDLVQELLEICGGSQTEYHDRMEEVKQVLKESELRKAAVKKQKKRLEAELSETRLRMEEAHTLYKRAVKMIPSGKTLVGVHVTQSLLELVNSLAAELVSMGIAEPLSVALEVTDVATQHFKKKIQSKKADGQAKVDKSPVSSAGICLKAMEMLVGTDLLQDLVEESGTIDPSRLAISPLDYKSMFLSSLKKVEQEMECDAKATTLGLCQDGLTVCEQLEEVQMSKNPNEAQLQSLAAAIEQHHTKVQEHLADTVKSSGTPAITPQPPNLTSATTVEVQEGLAKKVLDQAYFRVEQAKSQLDTSREDYQKISASKDKVDKDLDEVLLTMSRCQVKNIDYATTLKLLQEGLRALSQVKEQWAKMSNLFQMTSNLIKISLNDSINQFTSDSETCELIPGYSQDSFIKDTIYSQAVHASSVANLCHMIADTYVEVSQKHLRDQITSLETNIALTPSDSLFNVKRTKLQQDYTDARKAIRELVLKNKDAFDAQIQQKIDHINSTLQNVKPLAIHQ
ncbi:uncharacterized protein [Narcine bancroftii]|uniref:uncharacterized protein n=1 Tax=Narcine bancroftii TaxID=1343680 RepID=UPI003831D6C4